ncbi:MAG: class I SAM-dependent RNA methyltransferase [Bacteroidota bacterium]
MKKQEEDFPMLATTLFGLEEVLAQELLKLGARNIEKQKRAVSFVGDKGFMYKANYSLRTATRVLVPIQQFFVKGEEDLYTKIKKIEWEKYLHELDTFAIDTSLKTHLFTHSQYISQKAKDAVVDRFREKTGKRPSVDLDRPWLRINLHVYENTCIVSLDSSGNSLHKRNYRDKTNLAPLNEVLAAGMILLTGWDKRSAFVDPMCGSGTIVTEAALIAGNIPPGYYREEFGFMHWKDFDKELWELIRDSCLKKISNEDVMIYGSDLSPNVTKKAKQNVKEARVEDMVTISTSDFAQLEKPAGRGVLVMNPPYGERMDKDDITALYKTIGDTLKKNWSGWTAWLITSNEEAAKAIGLRHTRRITLYNGGLECKYLKFEMYEGTKKVHKLS